MSVALLVIAKEPLPGRSKTRLSPPCTPGEAARLAEAALADTLGAVAAARVRGRRVLVLDGAPGPWLPAGFEVVPQRGGGLDERLAHAFEEAGGPGVLVGMDTPQLTPRMVEDAALELRGPGVGAVLGPAADGGYWAIGLREPDPEVFLGVPMSTDRTCDAQRTRLRELGIPVAELGELRDVDTVQDAFAVATLAPATRFARVLAELSIPTGAVP
ncbi:MAG TPA: TIGR04282 family arsenosugar biosynthesis glycosyltransferase [Actinomycetota bacterium]|jgi:rSAM/selenodomain-associated transferase 1|nr:TIGR04282 family arsenosugar biosynthesis glycosyltransferase [Actinomycetota bacterium]